jgi:hypothetical protein
LNIFQIFNELTFKRSFYTILIDVKVVSKLKEVLLKPESPECCLNAAIRILNVLISHLRDHLSNSTQSLNSQNHFMDDNDEVVMEDNREVDQEQNQSTEDLLKDHSLVKFFHQGVIDHLVKLLEQPPHTVKLDFQYGDNQFVLGKKRLASVNLLESLVELDDSETRKRLQESNFYEYLFNLFLEYRFNTFLHLHLDNIFHRILKDPNTSNEDKVAFVQKLKIFEKLPSFWSDNQHFAYPSQREYRHGYLAFTTRFANTLREIAKTIPEILAFAEKQDWKNFIENDVEVYNEKNNLVLANRGGAGRKDSDDFDELDDDKFRDLEEREDLEDDKEDEEDEEYGSNRNSMRKTLQEYDASKAREEHENMFIGENIEKDEEEDNLFSGLNSKAKQHDSSDEDQPISGNYEDSDSDDDSENEKEDVSESSDYYDNSYWQVDQFSIEDLLQG